MTDESAQIPPDEGPAEEPHEPVADESTPGRVADDPPAEASHKPAPPAEDPLRPAPTPAEQRQMKDRIDEFDKERRPADAKPAEDTSWNKGGSGDGEPAPDANYRARIKGGVNVVGDNATAHIYNLASGRQITLLRYDRSKEWIEEARETFAYPSGYADYVGVLREHRLLYLRGNPGSGRRLLAEMLLAAVAGDDFVTGLQVTQSDVTLAAVAGERDLIPDNRGTVLELASLGTVGPATLAALAGMALKAGGYLVVLGSGTGAPDRALHPYEITPPPPNPREVLRLHLEKALGDGRATATHIAKCLEHEEVARRLQADPQPASVADLARALAGWNGTDEDLARALNKIRARIREIAARLVKGDDEEESPLDSPRRQAVQIAYAAFDGHPLSDVFGVGSMLHEILLTVQTGEERSTRMVFDAGVEQMLRLADGTVVVRLDGAEHPRRAHFTDPNLAFDLLDVVWNDFDSVRVPLLFWLHQIVLTGRPGARQRAAYIAGWLATHDFDEVWRLLIRPWALDDSGAARQAAAWAVDILAIDGRMLGSVRGRVRDWVRSFDPRLHDTAARAYGTQLGVAFVEDALTDLETLAGRDDLNGSASVAAAMRFLYLTAPDKTRDALIAWTKADKYRMRVHAARSLILISSLAADEPREQWPRLLSDVDDAGGPSVLVELWQAALTDPTTALRAWKAFYNWLQWAGADPDLEDRTVELGALVLAVPAAAGKQFDLKKRSRFYLRQWRASCPAARRLFDELWPPAEPLGETA